MFTTDEANSQGDAAAAGTPPKRHAGWMKHAKRYGPMVVVLALIGGAVSRVRRWRWRRQR